MPDSNVEKTLLKKENQFFKWLVPLLLTCLIALVVMMWQDMREEIRLLKVDVKANTALNSTANTLDASLIQQILNNKEGIMECRKDIRELRSSVSP